MMVQHKLQTLPYNLDLKSGLTFENLSAVHRTCNTACNMCIIHMASPDIYAEMNKNHIK